MSASSPPTVKRFDTDLAHAKVDTIPSTVTTYTKSPLTQDNYMIFALNAEDYARWDAVTTNTIIAMEEVGHIGLNLNQPNPAALELTKPEDRVQVPLGDFRNEVTGYYKRKGFEWGSEGDALVGMGLDVWKMFKTDKTVEELREEDKEWVKMMKGGQGGMMSLSMYDDESDEDDEDHQ